MAPANPSVGFASARHLAEALMLCWKGDFPKEVTDLPSGYLAIPTSGFKDAQGNLATFEHFGKQHGWRYELTAGTGKIRSFPLRHLISEQWTYHDPLRYRADGTQRDDGTIYDPSHPSTEYLIGARTKEQAASILGALTAHVADDIQFVPLAAKGSPAFPFFWLLTTDRPPLDVLREAAARVWWGPISAGTGTPVYLQWPYSLAMPRGFLGRLPWDAGSDGIVLLSRKEPEAIILKADFVPAQPAERFADLRVATRVEEAQVAREDPSPRFAVQLKLDRGGAQDRLGERVRELESELGMRQRLLESLRDELARPAPPPVEPLFLYYAEETDGVPTELRRLLIEWTDHAGDLGSVRYARLAGASLPEGFDRRKVVHVVTTNRALGEDGDASIGARLTEYRARYGVTVHFDQLFEWTPHELSLFIPHGRALRLYPRLRPGPIAANQLARALFGREVGGPERSRWLVLLVPGDDDRLRACRIEKAALQPIAHAVRWSCNIDVAEPVGFPARETASEAKETFFGVMERDFEAGVNAEANARIAAKSVQLETELTDIAAKIETVQAANQRVAQIIDGTSKFAGDLGRTMHKLQGALDAVRLAVPDTGKAAMLGEELGAYRQAVDELMRRKGEVERLIRDIETLRL